MRNGLDGYAPGWSDDAVSMMASRTAESRVGFFLAALAPGMDVLDAGCGPGTITAGLARAVEPGGSCTGIDREPSQIELAQAATEGVAVTLAVASIYELPFADASFDAALSHAVFEHLARPADALAELRRVLRRGGIVGVCSSDWEGRGSTRAPTMSSTRCAVTCGCGARPAAIPTPARSCRRRSRRRASSMRR